MPAFINKFDHLPIEVLLEIFGYLPVNDCFKAFSNLNSFISSALRITNLSIDLTWVSNRTYREIYEKIILPRHSHQIRKLKLSNDLTFDLLDNTFHRWNFRDFKNLRSLTLIQPSYMTLGSLTWVIPHLKYLEHLSVDSSIYPEKFLEIVTTRSSSIKSCYLPNYEIKDELKKNSSIERLIVTVLDIHVLLNLVSAYSQLKYLQVTIQSTIFIEDEQPKTIDRIICPNLETLKLCIVATSFVRIDEIVFCFDRLVVDRLQYLSYHCASESFEHCDVEQWNILFSSIGHPLEHFDCFLQIPYNADLQSQVEHSVEQINKKYQLVLTHDESYFQIHSPIYPLTQLNLFDGFETECDSMKYSRVRSLKIDGSLINDNMKLPPNITYLHLVGNMSPSSCVTLLFPYADQLHKLNLNCLPDELPTMKNLRELTIQKLMIDSSMIDRIAHRCPQLELLTIETNVIDQFQSIIDGLHQLRQLKYLRVFSRDSKCTWSDWLEKNQTYIQTQTFTEFRARNLFLFVWF